MDRKLIEQFIRDLIMAINAHDISKISAFFAVDFKGRDITYARKYQGKKDLIKNLNEYFSAFTDVHFTVDKRAIEESRIVLFWSASALHSGVLLKIPPSFKRFTVQGVWLLELKNSRICRGTSLWDMYGFLRSIRLMPDLPHEKRKTLNN